MSILKHYPMLGSSTNPQQLSRTVTSATRLTILALAYFGIANISESEANEYAMLCVGAYEALKGLYYGSLRVYNLYLKGYFK